MVLIQVTSIHKFGDHIIRRKELQITFSYSLFNLNTTRESEVKAESDTKNYNPKNERTRASSNLERWFDGWVQLFENRGILCRGKFTSFVGYGTVYYHSSRNRFALLNLCCPVAQSFFARCWSKVAERWENKFVFLFYGGAWYREF